MDALGHDEDVDGAHHVDTELLLMRHRSAQQPRDAAALGTAARSSASSAALCPEAPEANGGSRGSPPSSFLTPVVWCILVTEAAERFAYFGFRALLVLYFTVELDYAENTAIALYGYNSSLAYFTPMLGALLADGYLGRYRTILSFGCVYVVGLAVLSSAAAASDGAEKNLPWQRVASFAGLFLVCVGTGGIKPCVSAFGADQVARPELDNSDGNHSSSGVGVPTLVIGCRADEPDAAGTDSSSDARSADRRRSDHVRAFFNYFYFCINVGALTSIAIVPLLRARVGFGLAFGVPCLFMIAAMCIFLSKRRDYIHQKVSGDGGGSMLTTFRITWWLLTKQIYAHPRIAYHCPGLRPGPAPVQATEHSGDSSNESDAMAQNGRATHDQDVAWKQQVDDAAQAMQILPVLAMFPIFWCLYDQQGSVWTLQAARMALPAGIQPEQLNIVNPLQIMILIPLFDRVIYPCMERRRWNITPLRRMAWGMLLTAAAFFVSGVVESSIHHREVRSLPKVHVLWQLPQITILAVGEILLSVTGLEFAYSTAPDRLKAFVTALFLCTTGVGDFFSGILFSTVFAHMNRAAVMHVCAALMLCNLRIFLAVAKWYDNHDPRPFPQEGDEALALT